MKATLFSANQKAQKTIEMEKLVGLIRDGYKEKQVAALREELRYTIPGVSVKEANRLPVVYFCSTVKKQDGTFVRNQYNGLVLLKINNLANCNEAKNVRWQAAGSLQTMAAFIGSSGKSVKIIIPFTLSDHTVPQNDTLIRFFHARAYDRAAAYYGEELQQQITVEENELDAACRLSFDPDIYYNPDALPIRIEQPWETPEKLPVSAPSPAVTDPLQRLVPGYERSRIVSLLFENS